VVEVKPRTRHFLRLVRLTFTRQTPPYLRAGLGHDFSRRRPLCRTCRTRRAALVGKTLSTECGLCLSGSIADDKSYARATT
jgi:hypothetical protein